MNSPIDWTVEPDLTRLHEAHRLLSSDPRRALQEFEVLAAAGSTMALIYLGDAYKLGRGTKADVAKAEKWYRQAADTGSPYGQYLLGRLYFASKRYDEAFQQFTAAANRDYIPAFHFLGRMYATGRGCMKNIDTALQFLAHASEKGNVPAKGVIAHLLTHGPSIKPLGFLRGVWLYAGMWIDLLTVMSTEGRTSDRLR